MGNKTIEVGTPIKQITIPEREEHGGVHSMTILVDWVCLKCGAERGKPFTTVSWDGSRQLNVTGWKNPCGHIEKYSTVRENYLASQKSES
jgi:hypothetical protein